MDRAVAVIMARIKNAVRTARLAWHDTIVGKDVDKEFDAIDKLDRAIESSGMAS
jgi:hypothetical protein